ncbi:MAG: hypothetical protein WCK90_00860 [archaeon]
MANETKPTDGKSVTPIAKPAKSVVKKTQHAEAKPAVEQPVAKPVDITQTPDNKMTEKSEVKSEVKSTKPAVAKIKKDEAIANLVGAGASKKQCMYICNFIKGKKIDDAIADLILVTKFKKIIPFKGEIPHRKGPGMMSGRWPVDACKLFITMLKGLKGNAIANGMDLDKTRIYFGMSNWASRPARSGGRNFKRTHVLVKAKEFK